MGVRPHFLKTQTLLPIEAWLAQVSETPPEEIEKHSTDTRAWLITSGGWPWFVKWVETARYEERLARDAAICQQVTHLAIPPLLGQVETADGVALIFEKVDGENLGELENRRRFFDLPVPTKFAALRQIFGALTEIVDAGWVLVDFYEGNVLYDFDTGKVWVFDFELFEPGKGFTLQLARNYGSSRLMAPEEFVKGEWIDQSSNVYTLGRYVINALCTHIAEGWRDTFSGSPALADVLARATHRYREARYPTVRAFVEAFERETEKEAPTESRR